MSKIKKSAFRTIIKHVKKVYKTRADEQRDNFEGTERVIFDDPLIKAIKSPGRLMEDRRDNEDLLKGSRQKESGASEKSAVAAGSAPGEMKVKWKYALLDYIFNKAHHLKEKLTNFIPVPKLSFTNGSDKWASYDADSQTINIEEELFLNYPWHVASSFAIREFAVHLISRNSDMFYGYKTVKNKEDALKRIGNLFKIDPFYFSRSVESKKSTPDPVANTMDFTTDPKTQSVLTETRNILATAAPEADLIDVFRGAIQTIKTSDIKLKKRAGLFGIYCYTIIPLKEMRDVDLISGVMNFLARKLCVNPIIINSYDTSTCKDSLDLELNGRIKSVLIAEFSFYYLMREVEKMWADLKKGKGLKDNSSKADFQKILLASFEAPFDFDKISYFEPENPGLEKYVKAHHIAITQRTRIRLPVDDDDE